MQYVVRMSPPRAAWRDDKNNIYRVDVYKIRPGTRNAGAGRRLMNDPNAPWMREDYIPWFRDVDDELWPANEPAQAEESNNTPTNLVALTKMIFRIA
ncbi:MAG TPA: hypothetical protein DEQ02_05660 [Ruminococcaceae bacterium]|nr:hypothetical protein [Oscillospiraceae bacterium]